MPKPELNAEALLSPADVAKVFGVDSKTVTRWAKAGRLASIRTPGGHRRYRETEVEALLQSNTQTRAAATTARPTQSVG